MALREPLVEEPTIGKLVKDVTEDVSHIVRQEIRLAKSELKVSMRLGGLSAGLFGAAVFLVLLAVVMLSVSFGYFLTMTGLHPAFAFLIVFGVYVLVAAILGFVGVKKIKKVKAPERAIDQAQQTAGLLKR